MRGFVRAKWPNGYPSARGGVRCSLGHHFARVRCEVSEFPYSFIRPEFPSSNSSPCTNMPPSDSTSTAAHSISAVQSDATTPPVRKEVPVRQNQVRQCHVFVAACLPLTFYLPRTHRTTYPVLSLMLASLPRRQLAYAWSSVYVLQDLYRLSCALTSGAAQVGH